MTVRWGLLGAGWIATKAMAPALHAAPNAQLHGVASRSEARARKLHPESIYKKYQDLLEDPAIEVVYIALANHLHLEWVERALAAGKHVLCEKPMALSHSDAVKMAEVARISNRLLVEATTCQWHPRFRRAMEIIQSGEIGEIKSIQSAFTFPASWQENYRLIPEMGGGALYDVGGYQVHSWAELLPDCDSFNLNLVKRERGTSGIDLTTDVSATTALHVKLEARSSFQGSEKQSLKIEGQKSSLEFLGNQAFTSWKESTSIAIGFRQENFPAVDPYQLMIESFSQHILDRKDWVLPLTQSLKVAQIIDFIASAPNTEYEESSLGI